MLKIKTSLILAVLFLSPILIGSLLLAPAKANPDIYYPSAYSLLGSTAYVSGSLSDVQSDNGVYLTYRSYPTAFSTTANTPAFVGHRSNTGASLLNSPKARGWNGATWDASETELSTAGSPVRFVRVAYSTLPQYYDYKIVVALSDDGTLDAYVYNGTAWRVTNNLADLWTTAPTGSQRPYDIVFETSSGNALLVYGWFDGTTNDLAYRRWFAGNQSWSGQVLIDDPTEATEVDYSFVLLDNDKVSGSNYIGLIALVTTSSDSLTGVWNGSNWVSLVDLSTSVSITSEEDIGVAWAYDGSLMVVSGEGANEVVRWRRYTKTVGWGTSSTFDMDTLQTLLANWITIKADPATDDLMLTMIDSGSDLHTGYWNGASWSVTSNIDTNVDSNARRCADFEWEPSGSRGLLVRGTTTGTITWRTWTSGVGWGADSSPVMGVNTHLWVQLRRNPRNVPGDVKILGGVLEITANDLGVIKWDGTTFTVIGASTLSADTAASTYECFDLEFQNFGDPTSFRNEVEFAGSSDTQPWTKLTWTTNIAWSEATVNTTVQLYNYQIGQYPTSGNGYSSYISSAIPDSDQTRNQTVTSSPTSFRDATGNWRLKITGEKGASARFNLKADLVSFETSIADITPPAWSNAGTNSTIAGQPTRFYVRWTDNSGLGGFIFGTNNTGTWSNDTWVSMSGTTSWSNVTKTLNSVGGKVVQWRVWANDTSNNWADTGLRSLTTQQPPVASFTYSPTTPYTSDAVAFNASASYDPDGTISSYTWTFGDGNNATGVVTNHAYAENGVYIATLRVTDNDGLTNTFIQNITVLNRIPTASFTQSATTAPTGTTVSFNGTDSYDPDGTIASYFWTFGDGTNASGTIINHAYTDNGTYTVTLRVTDNDGGVATSISTITITNRAPTASFTSDATTPYTGVSVNFTATSSYDPDGLITSYFWTFGDGTNATGIAVSHVYVDNGLFTVTLTVTDNDGGTTSTSSGMTVLNRRPIASFTESASTVYKGETIYFNASASYDPDGTIASYFWTFGDGSNATGVAVSHSYVNVGSYTVTLTVADNDGATDSETAVKTVLTRLPIADFTESATIVYTGDTITFNASASYDPDGTIVNYSWNLGDGSNASGALVIHAYSDNGVYTVMLTVTDSDGATDTAQATITVLNRPPIASFTESATTVLTGQVIYFNASTSYDLDGSIVSYFWTFGDGTNGTGAQVNHAYADNGIYTVTLTVTDDDGAAASTNATKTVLNRPPIPSFTESAQTVYTGQIVTFNAAASNDPDGWIASQFWDFGDGTNATGVVTSHSYSIRGNYTVTLTVTDNDGATTAATSMITVVNQPPVASFTESATTVYKGEVIFFNASASSDADGSIVSYFWTFGDGTNATGVSVSHAYSSIGTYAVTLIVTDNDGATDSHTAVKTVLSRPPVANFTQSATTVNTSEAVNFNASTSYDPDGVVVSYFWTFGDGTNATGVNVSHAYSNNGVYTITLTVTDNDGTLGNSASTLTVLNRPPVASFTESATTVLTGEVIHFNASTSYDSDGFILNYFWMFGDGTNATGIITSHSYVNNGVYTVSLRVTDDDGSTATTTAVKTILNRPPVASFTQSTTVTYKGETVRFNASNSFDLDGVIISYLWTFEDGTNATGMVVDHAYANVGNYTVTLTVTDDDSSIASTTSSVTVQNRPPVAQFTQSATTAYTGVAINFNASGSYDLDGSIVTYFWTFGDGTNASGILTSHSYADNGIFTVSLTVTDNDGATDTQMATITILNRPPVASFTTSATTVLTSQTVSFNASASYDLDGWIIGYFWTFGDGTNSTGNTSNHAYADNGVFTVTLTVTDDDGTTSQTTRTITVLNRLPVASSTKSATSVLTRQSVTFNASASYDPDGTIASYTWDFGDGNITTVAVPIITHWYTENGTYTVTLTVTDNDGAINSSSTTITVLNRAPAAIFNQSATIIYTNQAVTFNASASYDLDGWITAYTWDFGDGNLTTVATPVINHVYQTKGTLTVTLAVQDNDGTTNSSTSTVTVLNRPPIASFTRSATTVFTGESVYFNASSSYDPDGSIVSYFWTFGDGTNATGVIVSHAYSENGPYTVTLTVNDNDDASGNSSAAETVLNRLPVASFTESASTVYTGVPIQFNASLSYDPDGAVISYFWTFGDGQNATGIIVNHPYVNSGIYTVTLRVTDNDGGIATATATKTVLNRAPTASFTESASTVLTGEAIFFNASASYDPDGVIASYFWTFGDGANASEIIVGHSYADNGIYTVTLTVTDDDGATSSQSATKTVLNRPPVASFTESAETVVVGQVIFFNASQSYDPDGTIANYFWTFGDGTNATGITAQHAYSDNGVYTVTLIVTDNDGATASTSAVKVVAISPPVAAFTESASIVYTNEIIRFNASVSYDPDGIIVSYFWTFGDGSNATGIVVDHAYAENGAYTVTLRVTDDDGASDTATATKTVLNRLPVASFTESATTVYTGEVIAFNASASYDLDGSIVSFFWTFGDGTNATGVTVTHAYADNGSYTVTLTVTDNDGATASTSAIKTVLNRSPNAFFTQSATTVLTSQAVQFNASASYDLDGSITSFVWAFGDGTNSSGMIVNHSYGENGIYTVTLRVTDNDGATTVVSSTVTVLNRPPIATFLPSATHVLTDEVITFDATSSYDPDGFILDYFWTFGDGANATGDIVQHSYATQGVYSVTLTLTDNDGANATATTAISVQNQLPIASYTYTPSFPIAGQAVIFNATSSRDPDGSILSYTWNFGDGNITTTTVSTIVHTYTVFGNYTVTLTVTDNNGGATADSQTVRIRDYPTAVFSYTPSFPTVGQAVTFDASLSMPRGGTITNYLWNFGDGTPQFSTANPITTHAYSAFGNYTVILTASDSEALSATTSSTVRIRDYPSAAFTFSPNYPIERETVTFDATSSVANGGTIISYRWSFGDGNITTVTTPSVMHTYSSIESYTVTLTVADSEGLTGILSKIVNVRGYPVALFTFAPGAPYVGDTVTFNASLSSPNGGAIVRYQWNFGDTTPPFNTTNPITTHLYANSGNFTVTLTVTDSEGLSSSIAHSVVVAKAPVASFNSSPTYPKVGERVTFDASASYDPNGYVVSYRWNFGDGNVTTISTPVITHVYTSTGVYSVALIVTDNNGYTDTMVGTVTLGTPKSTFAYTPSYPIVQQAIAFNASMSYDPNGYIVSYIWNFGDNNITTATSPIVKHIYVVNGNYTVTLTVSDNEGLTDTTSQVVSVGRAPVASFSWTPIPAYIGDFVTFNGSASTPSAGSVTNYVWNYGDGYPIENKTVPTTTHRYTSAGNYTVSLTIRDSVGLTNAVTRVITISQAPVAAFTHTPVYPQAHDIITFNASSSYDPNGYIVTYVWNFGDGNVTTMTTPVITYVYPVAGNYSVALIVTDNQGFAGSAFESLYVSMRPPVADYTVTPTSPTESQTISFNATGSYDLDGTVVNYSWNFGDGNITAAASPLMTHRYLTYGNYTVELTVTDNQGLTNAKALTLGVRGYPTADFVFSPNIASVNSVVTFNASASAPRGGTITSYLWNFGDGSPQLNTTNPIATHIYNAIGQYTVALRVADNEGLTNTKSKTITVALGPVVSFTYSPSGPYLGDTVAFDASASYDPDGLVVTYLWDFGDGSPLVNLTNPFTTHVYTTASNYVVLLTATDNQGISAITARLVNVAKAPVAAFTYTPTSPIAGDVIRFDASGSASPSRSITNYRWDFGDGNITVVVSAIVTHVYPVEGNYNVSLTVTDTGGYSDIIVHSVEVRNYPTSSFIYSPSYPIRGQGVTFDATGSQPRGGTITSYLWNFGDGTPLFNATVPIATHVYSAVGQFTVTLQVRDSEGLTSTTTTTLRVRDYPTTTYTYSPASPVATYSVTFDASLSTAVSGNITGYAWDFGDGNITTITTSVLTHVFSSAGSYNVTLTITNTEGLSSSTSKILTVLNAPPIVSFSYSPSFPLVNQTATFDASASYDPDGTITSYRWNFGDGNITTAAAVVVYHVYKTSGGVSVTLTVTDNIGQTASQTITVRIGQLPTASFVYSPSAPYVGDVVTFDASTSRDQDGSIIRYSWNFGDGSIINVTNPIVTHIYSTGGTYTITLAVVDNDGLSTTTSKISTVSKAPVASFTFSPSFPIAGEVVTFDGSQSYDTRRPIARYIWVFGDGALTNTTVPTVTHTYSNEGNYTATLTVLDNAGYVDIVTQLIRIRNYPTASFSVSPTSPIKGQPAMFDASSSLPRGGTITNYLWDFGDGTSPQQTTTRTITHTYGTNGNFTARLTVTDSESLTSSSTKAITVREYPTAYFTISSPTYRMVPVTFNATASTPNGGTITSYRWEFGDGNITTVSYPVIIHTYASLGVFTVRLTVIDSEALGNLASTSITIEIAPPVASFTYSPSVPIVGQAVTFDASMSFSGTTIARYDWNFGDGMIASGTSPIRSHIYASIGIYSVTLSIMDIENNSNSTTKSIRVLAYPTASFTWSPLNPLASSPALFNASASTPRSGTMASYSWNFGDGNITTVANPAILHAYSAYGSYTVTLTVVNSNDLSNSTARSLSVYQMPLADFGWQPAIPKTGETVTFNASGSSPRGGVITTYRWDFGDGTSPVLVLYRATVTHSFTAFGQHTVTLTVTDTEGLTASKSNTVIVQGPPSASFSWSPNPKAYDAVTFDASSSSANGGVIINYRWDFGDGNIVNVSNPVVIHTYLASGSFNVNLTLTDSEGLSGTITNLVSVAPAASPQADFVFSPSSPYVFQTVTFDASASTPGSGSIVSYRWNFGDGNITTATATTIAHIYRTGGSFTITLTVTNTAGLSNVISKPVTILPISGPKADFTWSPSVPLPTKPVTFDGSISLPGWDGSVHPPIIAWRWSFGDGNTTQVSTATIAHVYASAGNYSVTLTVIDVNSATGSVTKGVKVSSLVGDLNGDGKVDIKDLAIAAKAFGSSPGMPNWNPAADMNGDLRIDIKDLATIAKHYGETSSMSLIMPLTFNASYPLQILTIFAVYLSMAFFMLTGKTRRKKGDHDYSRIHFRHLISASAASVHIL